LIVEEHQALHQKIEKLETRMEHEFLEVRALIQLSYRQLQERVETLEQRVQFIEKRLGLSA
jgi:tetrahydromethanopterin S-methyltransferase subunit G